MMLCRFSFISFGPGLMYRLVRMIGRRINGIELQLGSFGSIDNIVVGTGGNNHRVTIFDLVPFLAFKDKGSLALFDPEELVNFSMYFVANLFSRLQAHYYELGILPGEQYLSEIIIRQCLFLDRSDLSCHNYPPYYFLSG
jgi:hypothetical protein